MKKSFIATLILLFSTQVFAVDPSFSIRQNHYLSEAKPYLEAGNLTFVTHILVEATMNGYSDVIKYFIESGVDLDSTPSRTGMTALMAASSEGNLQIVKDLLQAGANANRANQRGMTALLAAVTFDRTEVVQSLIQYGADINSATADGETPLMVAARSGNIEIVRILIHAGADVNREDSNGHSALKQASLRGHWDIVDMLLASGAKSESLIEFPSLLNELTGTCTIQ